MAPPVSSIPASNSLWSPLDTVKDSAEALGIANLPNEVSNVLAMDVEYRIFQITEQALKFMRHSKRKTLLTKDINKALKVLNVEPLYGYGNNIGNSKPLAFKQALVGPGQTLYYIDENQVDFEKLINTPLPKIPRLVTFTAHWLVVEGVQPNIPQNPSYSEIKALSPAERGSLQNLVISENFGSEEGRRDVEGATRSSRSAGLSNNSLPVRPLIKHVISKELQLYFNKIIQVLSASPDSEPDYAYLKNAALVSLRSDPGLHQLVPYFIQFISETITNNLADIPLLTIMLESIYSLLLNDNIFLDPYIHALLPCILTLLLAKKIGKLPTTFAQAAKVTQEELNKSLDEVLAIREFAASLLDHILKNYGSNYNTLKPRTARTLLKALLQSSVNGNSVNGDSKKNAESESNDLQKLYTKNLLRNFGCYYGSLIGIKKLGNEIIRLVLVGNLKVWSEFIFFKAAKDCDEDVEMENETEITNMIVDREKTILTSEIIITLRCLKNDTAVVESEIDMSKLNEIVGEGVAGALEKENDGKEIAAAIFFGLSV